MPGDIENACNRAFILTRLNRLDEAIVQYDEVLASAPHHPLALLSRGTLRAQHGRHKDALADFDAVLLSNQNDIRALTNWGNALIKLDRTLDALACYELVLALEPANVDALNNRGATLKLLGRLADALASYEKALTVDPRHVDSLYNCGNLQLDLGRPDAAFSCYERAGAVAIDRADVAMARANSLLRLDRLEEARQGFEHALSLAGDDVDALFGLADTLTRLKRADEARAVIDRMLAATSGNAERLVKCAQMLTTIRHHGPAARAFRQSIEFAPDNPVAWAGLANALMETCDWGDFETVRRKVIDLVEAGQPVDPLLFVRLCDDPARQLKCARGFAPSPTAEPAAPAIARNSLSEKIRIAYLSPDFRAHPVAFLAAELFELHDRSHFDLVGLSLGPDDKSEMRSRIKTALEPFHDVRNHCDEQVAALVQRLAIDILVDLGGYTEFGRLGVMARRPAPIQVNYLGFPGTLGAEFVDYIVADPAIAPLDHRAYFTEKLVHLPDCYQPNDSKRAISSREFTRAEAGLPPHGVVFCSFNATFKILPATFEIWMRLLREVEGSVLWLLRTGDDVVANLRREAAAHGVDPDRLVFAPKMALADHLARHRLADLFLDTLPYNAHTTASDALWAGLPVVTCRGDAFAARVATSLLRAVGLPELVTDNLGEYEALALRLTRDVAHRQALHAKLERNRSTHPLFNSQRFCRHLESAYTLMHEQRLRGEPPREFTVAPIDG